MAYNGSTASSSVSNPPILVFRGYNAGTNTSSTLGSGAGLWLYNSTNGTTQLQDANFFTDAYYIGMKAGDMIMGNCCTGSSACVYVGVIGAVTTSGAALASTGASMTSTFS